MKNNISSSPIILIHKSHPTIYIKITNKREMGEVREGGRERGEVYVQISREDVKNICSMVTRVPKSKYLDTRVPTNV
jgi:hypothetical protein